MTTIAVSLFMINRMILTLFIIQHSTTKEWLNLFYFSVGRKGCSVLEFKSKSQNQKSDTSTNIRVVGIIFYFLDLDAFSVGLDDSVGFILWLERIALALLRANYKEKDSE